MHTLNSRYKYYFRRINKEGIGDDQSIEDKRKVKHQYTRMETATIIRSSVKYQIPKYRNDEDRNGMRT